MMHCEHERLVKRLSDLEARVGRMNGIRFAARWIVIFGMGLALGWFGHSLIAPPTVHAQADGNNVSVRSVRILNEQGRVAMLLAADKFGGSLRLFNSEGKLLTAIEADPDGGLVRIHGHDELERTFLGVGDRKGGGLLYFRNAEGKNMPMSLGVGPKGGYLSLNNLALNKRSIWVGTDDDELGGAAYVYDKQGFVRADLGCNKQGGMMNIYGSKKGKSHVYLGTGNLDLGGLLLLRNDDGKVRAEVGQGVNGGYVTLNGNKDDRAHVALSTSDDQRGGYVQVRGNNGKVQVELGLDKQGQGYIDTGK